MAIVMEMTLLLLFFGGFCTQEVSTETSISTVSSITEALNRSSVSAHDVLTRVPEKNDSTLPQTSTPFSIPETSVAAHGGLPTMNPTVTQDVSTKKSLIFPETSNASSDPTVPTKATPEPPMSGGSMGTSSQKTSSGTSEPPATVATKAQEPSDGTSGLPVTMATRSLETSNGTIGLHVTTATSSLATSNGTSGLPVTMPTTSLETSDGHSGPCITMATSSLETPKGNSDSSISAVEVPIMTTLEASTNTGKNSNKKVNKMLPTAILVALLALTVLLALLLLWRQRQKRRTGALTLSRGEKRNGVVDAWAGPARVPDEETVITTAAVSGGDKGSGTPEGEASGRRPTLTTFFGRRRSHQGSLALEEIKAGSAPSLKGEEEPLVGSEDGAVETPTSDGPEVGDVGVL